MYNKDLLINFKAVIIILICGAYESYIREIKSLRVSFYQCDELILFIFLTKEVK